MAQSHSQSALLRQHLIDPVICIRCNTCEETCPVKAISHDSRNYVVDPALCNGCNACISPCPTGSIDNWRTVATTTPYTLSEQLSWEELPPPGMEEIVPNPEPDFTPTQVDASRTSAIAPMTASRPEVNRYTLKLPATATVTGNYRVTAADYDSDTHHIVLDFGSIPFPILEGQSIGIIPPGVNAEGRPHHARQYSVASPRNGERPGYNNLALTVKRVMVDHAGAPVRGVASNFLCDTKKGDEVTVIGPFGSTFLMPDDSNANLLMICTGTGSAPMRAMTERRRRANNQSAGRLMLFFGARTPQELPYFGPLNTLSPTFIDKNLAFSRLPNQPRCYVQDLMRDTNKKGAVAELLKSPNTHIYVCGLKGMEDGVIESLKLISQEHALDWMELHSQLKMEGRIHFETY